MSTFNSLAAAEAACQGLPDADVAQGVLESLAVPGSGITASDPVSMFRVLFGHLDVSGQVGRDGRPRRWPEGSKRGVARGQQEGGRLHTRESKPSKAAQQVFLLRVMLFGKPRCLGTTGRVRKPALMLPQGRHSLTLTAPGQGAWCHCQATPWPRWRASCWS